MSAFMAVYFIFNYQASLYLCTLMNRQPKKEQLYKEACRYDELGDTYNAVKLFKTIIKLDPSWAAPFLALGRIYFKRREWKPCFHYK